MTTAPERLEQAEHPVTPSGPGLYARYIGAMLYFMGAALIAGAVVHYPIDPPQYTVICVVGAFVFLLGTVFNELVLAPERPNLTGALLLVVFSLLLSFGVGLVGGGIQHFTQLPERSALMTPIGLVMSYAAFIAKDTPAPIWLNKAILEKYRSEMKKYYYDPAKYSTYLEQLGIKYPTVRTSATAQPQ